jgi:hypothetical protein
MFFKGALYYKLENATVALAPKIRKMGQEWFHKGQAMQGEYGHQDTLVPSLRSVAHNNNYPNALDSDWIAPNAVLVGNVNIKEGSSVWHGATIRGDSAAVNIGRNTMI